jgi:hypothetical protein
LLRNQWIVLWLFFKRSSVSLQWVTSVFYFKILVVQYTRKEPLLFSSFPDDITVFHPNKSNDECLFCREMLTQCETDVVLTGSVILIKRRFSLFLLQENNLLTFNCVFFINLVFYLQVCFHSELYFHVHVHYYKLYFFVTYYRAYLVRKLRESLYLCLTN